MLKSLAVYFSAYSNKICAARIAPTILLYKPCVEFHDLIIITHEFVPCIRRLCVLSQLSTRHVVYTSSEVNVYVSHSSRRM